MAETHNSEALLVQEGFPSLSHKGVKEEMVNAEQTQAVPLTSSRGRSKQILTLL